MIMESSISSAPILGLAANVGGMERVSDALATWNSRSVSSVLSDFLRFFVERFGPVPPGDLRFFGDDLEEEDA